MKWSAIGAAMVCAAASRTAHPELDRDHATATHRRPGQKTVASPCCAAPIAKAPRQGYL
jgi:hypothetical protein